ncbi:N-acetylmuramoyl-L-alanine amidase [Candidatus Saccharibacteria bacterium]|nr:N-acetylmuramoyl-L-alanine amidase [Candidatus Saccharibacteria bacterium]MBI3337783.1 N-acetylmuramoyl-L-alanine amidase [Candidatus Saccharibacteria bacterium]
MAMYIDEGFWRKALGKPDWYLLLSDDFKRLEKLAEAEKDPTVRKRIKSEAYEMVESAVREERLPVAKSGDNFDKERKPIDTIIIHHTKNQPGMTLERLNAMHLLRIYGMYFASPTASNEQHLKGQPVWSGHFYNGQQVFWGYHWLVREDGTTVQILKDKYVGWHAGNWDINTRSIGICIDNDLSETEPRDSVINAVAEIIRKHYPKMPPNRVLGHKDVNDKTECPGSLFSNVWKQKLLEQIT